MATIIAVTPRGADDPALVNLDLVVKIVARAKGKGSELTFADGDTMDVEESLDALRALAGARNA